MIVNTGRESACSASQERAFVGRRPEAVGCLANERMIRHKTHRTILIAHAGRSATSSRVAVEDIGGGTRDQQTFPQPWKRQGGRNHVSIRSSFT